ncbi:TadE/TadG family type IV pilus assembly protein [Symmachiella dynata]|jgi:Flp pilus assembly protein TadG|uniref:TadE/TadG family type IV pilus assembly protein n=1 Tax=Symmachiella dynata TaxID=2527995 RepID=UPI00118A1103|nr:TadE family protein [Symmachiella dynata]QDT51918.1 TadE-like protein [Symmachiella dynata]
MRQIRQNKSQQSKRRGALTVEFALVVPVLFLFFFAQLEFSRANMIRNMITTACYEGARAGVVPGATADQVRATAQNILDIAGVSVSEITVTPSVVTTETTVVTVTIDVPLDDNSWIIPRYFIGQSFTDSVTLDRERMDLMVF